jgi:hypothetical protein
MEQIHGSQGRIIVSGILFWYPLAGVTYQFLHYLMGLQRLGYDVYYVEDSGRWVYDPRVGDCSPDASGNVEAVAPVLEAHGFAGRWAFRGHYPGGRCYGMNDAQIAELFRTADVLLNVTGAQEIRREHLACRCRIYVESDPFAAQIGVVQGHEPTLKALEAHHFHFTFGENLGADDCTVPVERFRWLPTRQPVVLELWEHLRLSAGEAYTTVTTWHNEGKDIFYQGERFFWTKDREFRKYLEIPRRHQRIFELATAVDPDTQRWLERYGWRLAPAGEISRDIARYRNYIQQSRGEFTVARDQYVRPRTGWFSDRSACYLAAGRPVITQETGFSKYLPTGQGLFGFNSLEEILMAVDAIESDYEGACRAAREIAAEYFAAEKVLAALMQRAGW